MDIGALADGLAGTTDEFEDWGDGYWYYADGCTDGETWHSYDDNPDETVNAVTQTSSSSSSSQPVSQQLPTQVAASVTTQPHTPAHPIPPTPTPPQTQPQVPQHTMYNYLHGLPPSPAPNYTPPYYQAAITSDPPSYEALSNSWTSTWTRHFTRHSNYTCSFNFIKNSSLH